MKAKFFFLLLCSPCLLLAQEQESLPQSKHRLGMSLTGINKWLFADVDYSRKLNERFEWSLGTGINLNPLIYDRSKAYVRSHPYPRQVYQLFNLNYGIRYSIPLRTDKITPFLIYRQHLFYTPFQTTEFYQVNGTYYIKFGLSKDQFFFNECLAVGIEFKLPKNRSLILEEGVSHNYFGKNSNDFVLGYQLKFTFPLH